MSLQMLVIVIEHEQKKRIYRILYGGGLRDSCSIIIPVSLATNDIIRLKCNDMLTYFDCTYKIDR